MSDQGHESVIIYDGRASVTIPYSVIRFLHSQLPGASVQLTYEELDEAHDWLSEHKHLAWHQSNVLRRQLK